VADLTESSWTELAEAMTVIQLEEKYHVDHAVAWFRRLGEGPSVTARERFAGGLTATIGEAIALFEPLPGEDRLVADGVLPRSNEDMLSEWLGRVGEALEALSLDYALARHGPVGEMVPTGSGEIPVEAADFQVPGAARRAGGSTRAGSPGREAGGGGIPMISCHSGKR
jgi:hypothetical protein